MQSKITKIINYNKQQLQLQTGKIFQLAVQIFFDLC